MEPWKCFCMWSVTSLRLDFSKHTEMHWNRKVRKTFFVMLLLKKTFQMTTCGTLRPFLIECILLFKGCNSLKPRHRCKQICIHVAIVEVKLLESCWLLHFHCTAKRNRLSEERRIFSLISQMRLKKRTGFWQDELTVEFRLLRILVSLSDHTFVHSVASSVHVNPC